MTHLTPLLGENALFSDIGKIFHPIFEFFGLILAGIYSVTHNYGLSIIGLTILIMLALTPVTIKSTKSMIAMQRLQPEMKKLQAKYKGPENREMLNQEMMKLYKENGTSPFGACLPSLLQMPFLIVLYSLIRGLSNTVKNGATYVSYVNGVAHSTVCHTTNVNGCAEPRYIPTNSTMYTNLVSTHGQMHWWFGMDLSSAPFSHHGTNQVLLTIPYLVLIGAAIFLQYYQMKQMNSRNPQAAAANPQMQTMQKFFPIIFGVIYLRVPAGATIYMVVSSAMRIATQDIMFRTGMVTPVAAEREIGAASKSDKPPPTPPDKGTTKGGTSEAGTPKAGTPKAGRPRARQVTDGTAIAAGAGAVAPKGTTAPKGKATPKSGTPKKPPSTRKGTSPKSTAGTNGRNGTNGKPPSNGRGSLWGRKSTGDNGNNAEEAEEPTPAPKQHPRSRAARSRERPDSAWNG